MLLSQVLGGDDRPNRPPLDPPLTNVTAKLTYIPARNK